MNDPILELRGVSLTYRVRRGFFRYHDIEVLEGIDLDVHRGETLGIVGRNGCGKSTLLRLMAGILAPDQGNLVRRHDTASLLSLGIGFDPELSGRDNILLSAMLLGASLDEARSCCSEIAAFAELGEFIEQPVRIYSSGMRTRLGFSVAITMRPDILLIDEALGTGDAYFRRKAERAIVEKIRSSQTVVLVSHSKSQLVRLCDRAAWIDSGRVREVGEAGGVVDRYEQATANVPGNAARTVLA